MASHVAGQPTEECDHLDLASPLPPPSDGRQPGKLIVLLTCASAPTSPLPTIQPSTDPVRRGGQYPPGMAAWRFQFLARSVQLLY